jgi:CubicO group peptidase (beta-lactamase class C family)
VAHHDYAISPPIIPTKRQGLEQMHKYTRRGFLQVATAGAGAIVLGSRPGLSGTTLEPGASASERQEMRRVAETFMGRHNVPGMEVSIARHGELVYDEAFGFADRRRGERLTPGNLFRIASVTKPITSVAIFRMIEQGRLSLRDSIFGPQGILRDTFGRPPYRRWVEDIRLEHLLTHTAGGWQNDGSDPMFRDPSIKQHELISWTIANLPIHFPPGQHYAYSNFGYCLLGRVIEKVDGRPYARYVRDEILSRCGVNEMRIAGNTLADRAEGEVVYDGEGEQPYSMNVQRMDSHGGWLARASDLVRFAIHVDGFSEGRNILKPDTLRLMTTGSSANSGYAKGWAVNLNHNWWHNGSLPGTSSILVRTASGLCWAALANTRNAHMDDDLDSMVWEMVRKVASWHA